MFAAAFTRSIDANHTVKDELITAIRSQSASRRISVTDLVNPRQAFFRWTRPDIQPSPERAQLMLSGTGFHALFGHAVSSERGQRLELPILRPSPDVGYCCWEQGEVITTGTSLTLCTLLAASESTGGRGTL